MKDLVGQQVTVFQISVENWNNCLPDTEVIGKKPTLKLFTINNVVIYFASGPTFLVGAIFPNSCSLLAMCDLQYLFHI